MSTALAYLAGLGTVPAIGVALFLATWASERTWWECRICGRKSRYRRLVLSGPGRWLHVHVGRRFGRCRPLPHVERSWITQEQVGWSDRRCRWVMAAGLALMVALVVLVGVEAAR